VPAHPLVVDLDQTLVKTDTLIELAVSVLSHQPSTLFLLPGWLLRGRDVLKANLAARATLDVANLPYNGALLAFLQAEHARGRRIILATAADERVARAVAAHVGLFDLVLASSDGVNLKGRHKLQRIREQVGDVFTYAGDARADVPIWMEARGAILVHVSPSVRQLLPATLAVEFDIPRPRRWYAALTAMRPAWWTTNLLVMAASLVTASPRPTPSLRGVLLLLLTVLACCLVASASYLVRDVIDAHADRRTPGDRRNAVAHGDLQAPDAMLLALLCGVTGLALGAMASLPTALTLLVYALLGTGYVAARRRSVRGDAFVTAALVVSRPVAGAFALGANVSVASTALLFGVLAVALGVSSLGPPRRWRARPARTLA
jgi:hypothetical protein